MSRHPVRFWWTILPAILLLCTALPAVAQEGALSGTVTDGQSSAGLSAVQVEVSAADGNVVAGGFTSGNGAYRITSIPAGTYTVNFSLPGWTVVEETGVVITAGQTTSLAVTMTEQSFSLNPITVTTSRRAEKALDAPAAIEVVTRADIVDRPAVTPVDHVKEKAGVDFMPTGLQSSYTVVRGFNNVFSGSALNMTDFRISRVPSLRVNISYFNPTTSSDIERAEVVLGPGSALYGPNAANGVVHFITRSPIDDPGMDFAFSTGVRQQQSFSQGASILTPTGDFAPGTFTQASTDEVTWQLEGRLAWKTDNDKFGIKLSGSYFTGLDFNYIDSEEKRQQSIALGCQALNYNPTETPCLNFAGDLAPGDNAALRTRVDNVAGGPQGQASIGEPTGPLTFIDNTARDPDLKRWGLDLRTDFRPSPDMSIILSGGHTDAINSVDLTGIGAGQVQSWDTWYAQGRFNWKRLFAQVFWNKNSNDSSYLLRSGRPLIDKSYQTVAQIQHGFDINPQHALTYGLDFLYTNPQSETTINGRHEDDDDVSEVGGYVQYDGRLNPKWNLVAAARLDDHTRLKDPVFSPRAAIVFSPTPERSIRASYNRAFSTPNTLNLFLDISAQPIPVGGPFFYDLRAQGVTENGFTYDRTNGVPQHMSPFNVTGIGPAGPTFDPRAYLDTNSGTTWAEAQTAFGAVTQGACAADPTGPQCQALAAALGSFLATGAPPEGAVPIVAGILNPETSTFVNTTTNLSGIPDIPALDPTIWQTFEVGYKGLLLGDNLLLGANVYYSDVDNFVSALQPFTPNLFLAGEELAGYLISQGVAVDQASLIAGTVGSAQTEAGLVGLPLGVLAPTTAGGQTTSPILLTYRNLGDFNFFGADASLTYVFNQRWEVGGSISWVEKDLFPTGNDEAGEPVPLNAPKWKGALTLGYRAPQSGWTGAVRGRFVDGFPVASGVYAGQVDAYAVMDLNVGYRFGGRSNLTLQLDMQNVLNNDYTSFVGVPNFGRYTVLRLLWSP
ncbi:MAG: TonB-dependent receptor [marine benthic group bacterium]|nr:TonB-dependent receptor [Candidatus Benthicola marisminoris]